MKLRRRVLRNQDGVAAMEAAFALPILIVMIWMFVQLAQVYRALAGIQQGLGEGARFATLCVNPSAITGCSIPPPAVSGRRWIAFSPGARRRSPNPSSSTALSTMPMLSSTSPPG